MRTCVALVLVLLLGGVPSFAQEMVSIRLTQPPPGQLRVADLWKVELDNRSGRTVRVYLHGSAEERSIPDGIIVDAFTRVIDLRPGRTMITGNDVQPIRTENENPRYRDALLQTGSVPTGEYEICCEVISSETDMVLGRDCKFVTINKLTVPILVAPPDESFVTERMPTFSWLPPAPVGPTMRLTYQLRVVEIFGRQTPQDAMARNPAFFEAEPPRPVFLYPVSARAFSKGARYAWKITVFEETARARVNVGESEIWSFTYGDDPAFGRDDDGTLTAGRGEVGDKPFVPTTACPGENWDFELGSLACWTPDGTAWFDQPSSGTHPVLGDLSHHRKFWLTSYAAGQGDAARGNLVSEEFQVKNSAVGLLFGGVSLPDAAVELLVEKFPKDTFSLATRKVPGAPREYWVARTTYQPTKGRSLADNGRAGMSDRLVPVEWDVRPFLNRTARIIVVDQSTAAHVNVDHIRFYDLERRDTIKQPVLVMAAGERHSLAVTPKPKPEPAIRESLVADVTTIQRGKKLIDGLTVVNETSFDVKGTMQSVAMSESFAGAKFADVKTQEKSDLDYSVIKVNEAVSNKIREAALSALVPKPNILWGWGSNLHRAVARAYGSVVVEPQIVEGIQDITALAGGMAHSVAVTRDGKLWTWGLNDYWQLGNSDEDRTTNGTPKNPAGGEYIAVAAGSRHTIGLTKNGYLMAWGYNGNGELGLGFTRSTDATTGQVKSVVHLPFPFPQLNKTPSPIAIAAGGSHSAMIARDFSVWAWGVNTYGQCGVNPDDNALDEPQRVALFPGTVSIKGPDSRPVSVACGDYHTMVLMSDGTVLAWGGNASGQLGDTKTKDRHEPARIPGLRGIRAIAAGGASSYALDSAGVLWAWGNNSLGQLGTGDRRGRYVPTKVERLDAVTGVVAGGAHAMAVRADGGLWTWGNNEYGQMGEGAVVNLAPVPADPPLGPLRVERLATP